MSCAGRRASTTPATQPRVAGAAALDVVEVYPYVPYIQYLLPGSITMSIFMMVMIGGGIIFIDDKARGLHEGYLVTPITKLELIAGFNISGTIKAVLAGAVDHDHRLAHRRRPEPARSDAAAAAAAWSSSSTSFALISLMFLLMVRVTDPLMPRAIFGVLNTLLYFPSGAVYPQQGFPGWMQVDRGRRSVHLLGARVQEPAAQEHRLRRDRRRPRCILLRLLRRRDDRRDAAVQANAVSRGRATISETRAAAARRRGAAVRRARLREGHGPRDLPGAPAPTSPP